MKSPRRIAIVSHDAGGAEILANYVSQNEILGQFVLDGPAVSVFKRRLGLIETCTLSKALSTCDEILCGTSWQSDLEWCAIRQAKMNGLHVVAFLDHWINYPERFTRNGIRHLPDELCVGDEYAEILAKEHFPNVPIRLIPNPYFIEIRRDIAECRVKRHAVKEVSQSALFVSENISGHARMRYGDERYWGYTEFDAIKYFLEHIDVLGGAIQTVIIRPHPSDPPGKYDQFVAYYPSFVRLSEGKSLIQEILDADMVVGCESMAMVVGLLSQKKVVSCIPSEAHRCRLPQLDILHFREMVERRGGGVVCDVPQQR